MPVLVRTNITNPLVKRWVEENDLDPSLYAATVTVEDDGRVTLQRRLLNDEGHLFVRPGEDFPACEPETISPRTPFPLR